MAKIIKQNQMAIRYQPDGPGTVWNVFRLGESSATGKGNPGPGRTATYIADRFGRPIVGYSTDDPPGGQPSFTLTFWDDAEVSYLDKQRALGCDIFFQLATAKCGTLDNPNMWDAIDHFGNGRVGDITPGDGPVVPYAGAAVDMAGAINFDYTFRVVRTTLSALTNSVEAEDLNDIVMISDALCGDCGNGYPGADKIGYIVANAGSGVTPNVLYTITGGGAWALTSADPFAVDEHIGDIEWNWIDTNKFRLVVGCATADASALAKISYADVTLGAEATTAWTDVVSASASGANNETVSALAWLFFGRLYIATSAGEIYVSTDQGESWDDAAVYIGAQAIAAFAKNHKGDNVWAVGATNTILREVNQSGTFAARVGPAGGGGFTAVAVANNGTLYAGNGTSIFKSGNEAENAGGWTELKDFGADHPVVQIGFRGGDASRGGDAQCVWAVVDDATPGAGEVWESLDGGATWRQIGELANLGYNAAAFSQVDNNRLWVVGDTDAGAFGAIHLVS